MGGGKFVIGILILTLLVITLVPAGSEKKDSGIVDEKIIQKFNSGEESVRVIVTLKNEVEEKGVINIFGNSKKVGVNRGEIINTSRITEKVKHQFIYSNSFSADLTLNDIEELERSGKVEKIYTERVFEAFLQNSTELIGANETWALEVGGINLTGEGQAVCIIDSGINYNHSDLGNCYGDNIPDSTCKTLGGWDYCADDGVCNSEDSDPFDVEGHGTHVSGIVSANGNLKGVAPESKLIMIKASNGTGTFFEGELLAAVEWCLYNASIFNISVISMSLGGGLFSSQAVCDDYWPEMKNLVDMATLQNISVVVAAGNEGSTTQISYPACLSNAIAVGSIRKDDTTIDYNRNSMVGIISPGYSIYSTYLAPWNYATASGTSMATPHVSGAIAIIRQYLKLKEQSMTPGEIETLLQNNGKITWDGASGRNYSRLDIYSAIMELAGECQQNLINTSWEYFQNDSSCRNNDTILNNYTLLQYDENNCFGPQNSTFYEEREEGCDFCAPNWTAAHEGNLIWYNDSNNCYSQTNITSDLANRPLNLTENITENQTIFLRSSDGASLLELNFNLTSSSNSLTDIRIVNHNSSGETNNYSFMIIGGLNLSENINWTKTVYLEKVMDSGLICVKDLDAGNISEVSDYCNLTGETLFNNCSKTIGNYSCQIQNNKYIISGLRHSAIREQEPFCGDELCNNEESCSSCSSDCGICTDDLPVTGGGSSGGSSAPKSQIYNLESENLVISKALSVKTGDKILFKIQNASHSMEVLSVESNVAKFLIKSEPINVTISIGQEKKINLTSRGNYHLYIRLDNISNGIVNLTIQEILEKVGREERVFQISDEETKELDGGVFFTKEKIMMLGLGIFSFVILLAIVSWIFKKTGNKKPKKNTHSSFYFLKRG